MTPGDKTRRTDLREQRRRRQHGCWDNLIVAPLWVAYEANLGTLLRTCDAVGACMAVPSTDHYHRALDRGDTLPRRPHVHWVRRSKMSWIREQRETSRIVAVELADNATPLTRLAAARTRTVWQHRARAARATLARFRPAPGCRRHHRLRATA